MLRSVGLNRLVAAAIGALALCAVSAAAQQNPDPSAKKAAVHKQAPRKPAKPVTHGATQLTPAEAAWTIQDALPSSTSRRLANEPAPGLKSPFSRIQLDTGSVGLETQTQVQDNRFSDGRTVPGLETEKRNTPSYFGLSLSVPTTDKSIIPVPLIPRRE